MIEELHRGRVDRLVAAVPIGALPRKSICVRPERIDLDMLLDQIDVGRMLDRVGVTEVVLMDPGDDCVAEPVTF